jgi:regulatory protein
LSELALAYVARFATTRHKLLLYLRRKLRERGWDGSGEPALDDLCDRLEAAGYIDEAVFALSKARGMAARGLGKRRVAAALAHAGVVGDNAAGALSEADSAAFDSALRFARRRRIGPFAAAAADPSQRQKWLAAMVRAGHDFDVSRRIIGLSLAELEAADGDP